MIRIITGLALLGMGAMTLVAAQTNPSGGIVWTGGLLVGGWLLITGIARAIRHRSTVAQATQPSQTW